MVLGNEMNAYQFRADHELSVQRLALLATEMGSHTRFTAKVQGPFDGHPMTLESLNHYGGLLYVAGGVGVTAVLPHVKRFAIEHATRYHGMPSFSRSAWWDCINDFSKTQFLPFKNLFVPLKLVYS
jgi:hypothetical protein